MKPIHWRRTRLGNYLRHIPRPKHLKGSWLHRRLGDSLLHPDLWRPERSKIAAGFALGAFFSMIPMPLQMIPTLLLGYMTRVNLAASLVGVWISNPITTPPLFYLQYKIGHAVLGLAVHKEIDTTSTWIDMLKEAPLAILCGGLITGVIASIIGYPLALVTWDAITKWVAKSRLRRSSVGTKTKP